MLVKSADIYKSFNPSSINAVTAASVRPTAAAAGGKRGPAELYADNARSAARQRLSTAGDSSNVDQRGGQWVKCHDELSSEIIAAFPKEINKRTQAAAKKELDKRLAYGGMWQRVMKYATRKQEEDMEQFRSWMLDKAQRFREKGPDDFRRLCTAWGDVTTSGISGVYVLKKKYTEMIKLGMALNLQRRTNDQAGDTTARAVFVLSDDMIPNGFITEVDIEYIFGLDLPVFGGCDGSQEMQRTIIMNQICECIGTVAYEINSPGPLCEFLLMHGDDNLNRLTDPLPYLKKIGKCLIKLENENPSLRNLTVDRCVDMDTWPTLKSQVAETPEVDQLHNAHKHESLYLSNHLQRLTIDSEKIRNPARPCTEHRNGQFHVDAFGLESPYNHHLESEGLLEELDSAIQSGVGAQVRLVLNKFPRNTYFRPSEFEGGEAVYAANARENFDNQVRSLNQHTMMTMRNDTWKCINEEDGGDVWLDSRGMLKGKRFRIPAIEIGGVTVVPEVIARLFAAHLPGDKSNQRIVLVHNNTFTVGSPHITYSHRFSAIATIMIVSGFKYLVGLLNEQGLYEVSRLMKSCALVLCGPENSLAKASGSVQLIYRLVLPKYLIISRIIPGAAIVKRELKDGTGASFPFEALVLLLTKLGLDAVNTMLELVDSVCRFVKVDVEGEKFLLLATRTMNDRGVISENGDRLFHYLQFNNLLEHVYLKRATDDIVALGSDIKSEDVRKIVNEMNEGVKRTNFPSGARRDRKERLIKEIRRRLPLRSDIIIELKSVRYNEGINEGIDAERFNVHLDVLKRYIDECHDGSLGDEYKKKVFMPDYYTVGRITYNYYVNLIRRGKDGIGLYFRYELEGLGIFIQEEETTERAIKKAQASRLEELKTRAGERASGFR